MFRATYGASGWQSENVCHPGDRAIAFYFGSRFLILLADSERDTASRGKQTSVKDQVITDGIVDY
jgi:hypothetical protein